ARGADRRAGGAAFDQPQARGHHPGARSLRGLTHSYIFRARDGVRAQGYSGDFLRVEVAMAGTGQKLECDLVMRGGITSGIVYPRAIANLAETYRFRSIGGTSAGAIAAAAIAAGALGVREGKDPFQGRFKTLPEELAKEIDKKTVLERVFQPAKGLERLFAVLLAGLQRMSFGRKGACRLPLPSLLALRSGGHGNRGHSAHPCRLVARAWLGRVCRSPCPRRSAARSVRHPRRGNRAPARCAVPPAQERFRHVHRQRTS